MSSTRITQHRQAEANRRRVTTRGQHRIGQYRVLPKTRPSRRTVRRAGATTGLLGLLTAVMSFGGAVFTVAGAVTTAVGGMTVAWIEYRRDLLEVKRTGKPIQDKPPAAKRPAPKPPASHDTTGLSKVREPKPVDLDEPPAKPLVEEVLYGGKWVKCSNCGKTLPVTNGRPALHSCQPPKKPPARKPTGKAWPPKDHNPKCQAKSAKTCRCPKGRPGAKRTMS